MEQPDYDERKAARLESGQNQRFRYSKDKLKFFQDPHERSITAQIKQHRRMSDTYDPDNPKHR